MTTTALTYDPYDASIDADPYPTFRRLRDEAPCYYNEQYDFFALSRYDDVVDASAAWPTYASGKGTVLEIIKSGMEIPPGSILFEDPPAHDIHRGLLTRVFTPRRIREIEPKVRAFCAAVLDPLVERGSFDLVQDFGADIPMRTIGMVLGIPESEQVRHRAEVDEAIKRGADGSAESGVSLEALSGESFAEYLDWRVEHPSDDVMTELLHATYTDEHGRPQKLEREAILNFIGLLAAAGNETTVRLLSFAGTVLAEHPDQRAELAADPSLLPGAVDELLRYEAPSPVQARWVTQDVEHHGVRVPAGSTALLLTASANRDEREFPDPDRFDIRRGARQHVSFGFGIHFCLGAHLARLEAQVALEELLRRAPSWEVDWSGAVQAHTSTVRGWEKLPVVLP